LGVTHTAKVLSLGDDQLRGEGEEIVEHRPEKRENGHDNDTENRVHAMTLPDARSEKSGTVGCHR
jgi:hypothetical protein